MIIYFFFFIFCSQYMDQMKAHIQQYWVRIQKPKFSIKESNPNLNSLYIIKRTLNYFLSFLKHMLCCYYYDSIFNKFCFFWNSMSFDIVCLLSKYSFWLFVFNLSLFWFLYFENVHFCFLYLKNVCISFSFLFFLLH